MTPMLSKITIDADSAAARLEMAAAGLDEAIVALASFAQAGEKVARLRELRTAITRDAMHIRRAIDAQDDLICDMLAAAIQADFDRAQRIHLPPPPAFRVVK